MRISFHKCSLIRMRCLLRARQTELRRNWKANRNQSCYGTAHPRKLRKRCTPPDCIDCIASSVANMASEHPIQLFFDIVGFSAQKASETLKNVKVTANIKSCIEIAIQHTSNGISKGHGMLLYYIATTITSQIVSHLALLTKYVVEGKFDSEGRVKAAMKYLSDNPVGDVNIKAFEESCGVGVVVTPEQIKEEVEKVLAKHEAEIQEKRYSVNTGQLTAEVMNALEWAERKVIKAEVDLQLLSKLGPKTEADLAPPKAEKTPKQPKPSKASADDEKEKAQGTKSVISVTEFMKSLRFHKPGENYKTDDYVITNETMERLKEHLKITGGQVRTRFPPEPNGILHIGHAKAININFGYAQAHDGICFLRYDDTNPEKEEEKFFVGIKDMVEWLGYKPHAITHSSDNFDQLYEWAKVLIKKGLAYVCHQKAEDIKGFNPEPSPWRDRSIEESLKLFEDMRNGMFEEGGATLRMKVTLEEGKLDPVAYRIKYVAHHRTGDRWCIYPTYDYTHCLCDSIEHITHSLCTKEFQSRRSSYYWLCNALDIYCPVQWEYGRLNVNYTVVSKRKIAKLITEKIVQDWDDPRLFTLTALRRRGFPPEAINNFCTGLGVTGAQSSVDPRKLEAVVRDALDVTAPRTMVVLAPLKVTIVNYPFDGPTTIEVPDFRKDPQRGTHKVVLDRVVYIDRSDFRETEEKGYRRLVKGQSVGLLYAGLIISLANVKKNMAGEVEELEVTCVQIKETNQKPKAFIHWVSQPFFVEVRLYDRLFNHPNPEDSNEVPGGFLSDINPNSLTIVRAAADKHLSGAKVYDRFQFERVGFFSVDPDTTKDKLVFNRTLALKEDAGKV